MLMLIKQKNVSLPKSLVLETLGESLIVSPPLFNRPDLLSSASNKANSFTKKLS